MMEGWHNEKTAYVSCFVVIKGVVTRTVRALTVISSPKRFAPRLSPNKCENCKGRAKVFC